MLQNGDRLKYWIWIQQQVPLIKNCKNNSFATSSSFKAMYPSQNILQCLNEQARIQRIKAEPILSKPQ
ncbi:hypothetical protein PGB90_008943 [Kerria lacca]